MAIRHVVEVSYFSPHVTTLEHFSVGVCRLGNGGCLLQSPSVDLPIEASRIPVQFPVQMIPGFHDACRFVVIVSTRHDQSRVIVK